MLWIFGISKKTGDFWRLLDSYAQVSKVLTYHWIFYFWVGNFGVDSATKLPEEMKSPEETHLSRIK